MYKRFAFEGDIHTALDCVPLTVRRKLDLAAVKVSLAGWQAFARDERLSLCHLPVDTEEDLAVYREVLLAICARRDVAWKPLQDSMASGRTWNVRTVPSEVEARARTVGARLDDAAWNALDEESRYALLKLADPKRNPDKIVAALVELGLLDGPAPQLHPDVAVCDAPKP